MKLKKEYRESIISTLKCYNLLLAHIEELKKQLGEVFMNDGVTAIDYAGDGIKTGNINKLVENTALKNIDDVEELKAKLDVAKSKLNRLDSAIGSLDMNERQVIILGYLKGYRWQEVANEMSYTDRMIRNLKKSAISKLSYVFYGDRAFEADSAKII
ncbi:hypothetical protein EZV73_26700 [Acidaminobacter sp. JC074]|uniref:sigma factor-like helix-turn-helix DNA-binding protein n=1 Tax=Acidaminobacter sp. JC074 TaxID=2530199 RepID=UPI001F1089B2|nr:sigma factor-like helix-turn-helix DNA-binding protein [Acidaminobacter sp. JC074]MCH4891197.1 hypothetical protein [Acidaminobacter sp. JC074]